MLRDISTIPDKNRAFFFVYDFDLPFLTRNAVYVILITMEERALNPVP
jgi:hypothetical protein